MKVLYIDCCIRRTGVSRTKDLCDFFLYQLSFEDEFELKTIDLNELPLAPMTREDLEHRNELILNKEFEDDFFRYAREFAEADRILIGAPFWNLTLPSKLKVYLEWVCMSGVTFCYEGTTCVGLCKAKKMLLISTAGFALGGVNNGAEYLNQLSKEFLGIGQFDCCCPEELDARGNELDTIMSQARKRLEEISRNWLRD